MTRTREISGSGQIFALLVLSQCFWLLCCRPSLVNGLLSMAASAVAYGVVFLLAIFCRRCAARGETPLSPVFAAWGALLAVGYFAVTAEQLLSAARVLFEGVFSPLLLLLVLLGSWWGVRRRDRAAEQEAEAEHLLAGAGEPNALPRRWVTLFWSQRSSIAESRWAGMVESSLIIGSDAAQCDLCLPDRKVSPQHCVLAAQGDALLVQPLSDRAKVYVNGERIDGEHRLQNNDTLRIGKTTVRLVL